MPKLLYSPSSPYSAKVRIAAAVAGIKLDVTIVNTGPQGRDLTDVNPLGKIPCLVTDDGLAVYDSRVITQWIGRNGGRALYPGNAGKRLEAERLEALADGICDCLLAHVYERRMRPEEKVHQPWLDLQWAKATRGLDAVMAELPRVTAKPTIGQIALRACLGYLDLRFQGQWEKGRTKLRRWADKFDARFPDLKMLCPTSA